MNAFKPEPSWREMPSNQRRRLARIALRAAFEPVRRDHLRVQWLRDASDLKTADSSRRTRLPRYMRHRNLGGLCREIESDGDRNARSVITDWLFMDGFLSLHEIEPDTATGALPGEAALDEDPTDEKPIARTEVVTAGRPEQARFRSLIRREAGGRCEISGVAEDGILEAAHIVTLSDGRDDNSVENGLFLTRNLHALFDKGCLWLEPEGLDHIVRFAAGVSCREADQHGQHIRLRRCFRGKTIRSERTTAPSEVADRLHCRRP